jgi:NAD(P)H-nitrite reductase large subunit
MSESEATEELDFNANPKDLPDGAILQRDKQTWAIVPRLPLGLLTAESLEALARVARSHRIPLIKITSGQRIALVGIEREELDAVWRELGLDRGRATELCVHYVQACPGTDVCRLGVQDSIGLGRRLEELFTGHEMPAKVKMGVSGCTLCCAESLVRDIGLIGSKRGWRVVFGGSSARRPRIADELAKNLTGDQAVDLVRRCLDTYRAQAKGKERTARFVERIGPEALRQAVLGSE